MKCVCGKTEKSTKCGLLMVLAVFLCSRFIYTDFNIRQFIGYGVLMLFLIVSFRARIRIPRNKYSFILLAILVLSMVCYPHYNMTKATNGYMIALAIFLVFFVLAKPEKEEIERVLLLFQITALLFAAAVVFFRIFPQVYWGSVYPLLSELSKEEATIYVNRGYGIPIGGEYPYENYIMAFGTIISFGKSSVIKKHKLINLIAAGFTFLGMLFTGRRSEPIAVLFVVMSIMLFVNDHSKVTLRGIVGVLILMVLLFVVLDIALQTDIFYRFQRTAQRVSDLVDEMGTKEALKSLFGGMNDITSGRVFLWRLAFSAFLSKPILGIGWGKFATLIPDSFNAAHGRAQVANVHNDILQPMCECGLIMGLLIVILRVLLLLKTFKLARQYVATKSDAFLSVALIASFGLQCYFLVLGLVDPCFYNSSFWGFYAVCMILMTSAENMVRYDNLFRMTAKESCVA